MSGRIGHRGWALVFLAVSVVLVAAGIAITAADVGQPTEKYYRVDVSLDSDPPFEMAAPDGKEFGIDGIRHPGSIFRLDCYPYIDYSRVCGLERLLLQSNGSNALVPGYMDSGAPFVQVGGRFYHPRLGTTPGNV